VSTIHQTSHEGWNACDARKQKEREDKKCTPTRGSDDNQPECSNLTSEEERLFENARQAVAQIKKTFEAWIVIGRGVEAARKRADRFKGKKKVFERILAQQGIDEVLGNTPATVKSTATRLLKILEHETEVMAWRSKLSAGKRMQWASPTAVYKHCPVFHQADNKEKAKIPKPSPAARIKELEAENAHLQEELSATKARYDAPEPKPGKVKGLMAFCNAWKDAWNRIDTVLRDTQALTPKERLEALGKLEDDIRNAKRRAKDELDFEAAEAPAPEPSPDPAALAEAAVKGEANPAGALGMTMIGLSH